MIRDVDRSEVIGPRVIDSPVLDGISPRELSGGVKTLIAICKKPDVVFNASACGDNCAKWLLVSAHWLQGSLRHPESRLGCAAAADRP